MEDIITTSADRALATTSNLERTFWLETIVDVIREHPVEERPVLFRHVVRRIETAFDTPPAERHDAVRFVGERIVPVE